MFDLNEFNAEYQTVGQDIAINGKPFRFLLPQTIDRFVNPDDPLQDFPLWAKIWPASTVLASYLDQLKVDPQRHILEIGSGIGLAGIVAAAAGHRTTITDYNRHALNFASANAALNGLTNLRIAALDWFEPALPGVFDMIVGSEVIYKENDIGHLQSLFARYLKPQGTVVLVEEVRQSLNGFFKQIEQTFRLQIQKKVLRSDREQTQILMIRMQPDPDARQP